VAQHLGVRDDRVRPEAGEVRRLLGGPAESGEGPPVRRRRTAGAALVEQHDAVVVQRTPHEPALGRGPYGLPAGAALQEQQPRQVGIGLGRRHDLAGEDLDPRPVRTVMVERDLDHVVGVDQPLLAERSNDHQ
jgi:hypothetical protein